MPFVTSMERRGIKKGRVEGRVQTTREKVIQLLSKRFGKVPRTISKTVGGLEDIGKLDELFDWAVDTDSLENFPLEKH